jgi:hypothetical protein
VAQRRIGIEIDEGQVTVAHVEGGMVTSHAVYPGEDTASALVAAMKAEKFDGPVRASLSVHGTALRRIEVTADDVRSRTSLEAAVFAAVAANRDTIEVAGLLPETDELVGSAVASATVAVAPSDAVDVAYRALAARRSVQVEVVPPPFALVGRDGLHLAVRNGECELTFVSAGVPVAFRQLRASGLVRVATGLDRASGGWQRLTSVLAGANDPIAESELTRWCTEVAHEAAETVAFWRRNGADVASDLWVTGPGAPARQLHERLAAEGFTLVTPDAPERALAYVDHAVRPVVMGAYLAAMSLGVGSPAAAFPNPILITRAKARQSRQSTLRIAAGVAIAALVVAIAGLAPLIQGRLDLRSANAGRDEAQARLSAVEQADVDVRDAQARSAVVKSEATDPRFSKLIAAVIASAPPGAELSQFNTAVSNNKIDVSVIAKLPPNGYDQVTAWLDRLRTDLGAQDLWTPGLTQQPDSVTTNLTFSVPAKDYPLDRDDTGQASS